jgi:hypothetical protein
MAIPHSTTGSLGPAFAPARLVGLAVRLAYIHILEHPIANRAEPTFALLRYSLGGYRPSKTDRLPVSLAQISGIEVRFSSSEGWCFIGDSTGPERPVSQSPTYAKHRNRRTSNSVQ